MSWKNYFKLLLIICLFMLYGGTKMEAQEWAPIGAKWHYSYRDKFTEREGYILMESIGDTTLLGYQSRVFNKTLFSFTLDTIDLGNEIMFEDSNNIFYFNPDSNSFCLLYDFKTQPGNSWEIPCYNSNNKDVKVDSVDSILINGYSLKLIYASLNDLVLSFDGVVIERVGWQEYFFPLTHGYLEGPLRCYEDSIIGKYETGQASYCNLIISTSIYEQNINEDEILIYPNPAKSFLSIKINKELEFSNYNITIINMLGKEVLFYPNKEMEYIFNISSLPKGLYFLKIGENSNVYKIINY